MDEPKKAITNNGNEDFYTSLSSLKQGEKMDLVLNPIILFIAVSAVIVLLIIVLVVIDYQLKKKKALERESIEYRYNKRFAALKQAKMDSVERVGSADKLARDFLAERFAVTTKSDYSQLSDFFLSKGKMHILPFCQTMTEILYSGEPVTPTNAHLIMISLESMLRREGVLSAIIESEDKKETNLVTKAAASIQKKVEDWKAKNAIKRAARQVADRQEESKQADKEQLQVMDPVFPVPKKVVVVPKDALKKASADRPEYKYIGSVDILDRIKSRIKNKESSKI